MVEKLDFATGFLYRITNGPCRVEIVPWGASVRSLTVPDRAGRPVDVALGYDAPEDYRDRDAALGAVVGRYANRISGASFTLNGKKYPLFANEGPNTLHGGKLGFHRRLWDLEPLGDNSVRCAIDSPDGDEGFPGAVHVEVTYTLSHGALTIEYLARSDADTVLNLTNHTYFNLAGHDGGTVEDHIVTLAASRFTPADAGNIPTGELRPVAGTPWDLREETRLGDRLGCPELEPTRGYDQNFVLDAGVGPAGRVSCPRTGVTMELFTDREGVQLYTAGWLDGRRGKGGTGYGPSAGLCLETQHFPDAVNKLHFPSPILRAGETFRSRTTYRFTVCQQRRQAAFVE